MQGSLLGAILPATVAPPTLVATVTNTVHFALKVASCTLSLLLSVEFLQSGT